MSGVPPQRKDCRTMLIVVYRWRIRAGHEAQFREGWRAMTASIAATRGGLGSRLHRAQDGTWVAYAQWPDRAAYAAGHAAASANAAAAALMAHAIAEHLATEQWEVADDLLQP
jgi:quinol monooxygenase YgiN